MENLNPIVTGFIGILATVALFLIFPDIRLARVKREHAESEKINAEADSIQIASVGDTLLKIAEAFHQNAVTLSENGREYSTTLKQVTDANVSMFQWIQAKDLEHSSERKIMLDRINELGAQISRLQDEKDTLEETLEAANIKITNLETDSNAQKKELRQLRKDNESLTAEIEKLKVERDSLLLQMANVSMPQLEADNLSTRILSKDGKDEIPNTSNLGSVAGDSANS